MNLQSIADLKKWLTKGRAELFNYSTRVLGYEFKMAFPEYFELDFSELRNEIAKVLNDFNKEV
jgi:hypothetical protein